MSFLRTYAVPLGCFAAAALIYWTAATVDYSRDEKCKLLGGSRALYGKCFKLIEIPWEEKR